MLVYQAHQINIVFSAETGVLQMEWKTRPTMAALKDSYLTALQFVEEHQFTRFYCTDLTQSGPFDREQEAWLNTVFYPKVYHAIRSDIYAAVVFSESHFKAIVSNYEVSLLTPGHSFIHFNYFTNWYEAQDWLGYIQKGQEANPIPAVS